MRLVILESVTTSLHSILRRLGIPADELKEGVCVFSGLELEPWHSAVPTELRVPPTKPFRRGVPCVVGVALNTLRRLDHEQVVSVSCVLGFNDLAGYRLCRSLYRRLACLTRSTSGFRVQLVEGDALLRLERTIGFVARHSVIHKLFHQRAEVIQRLRVRKRLLVVLDSCLVLGARLCDTVGVCLQIVLCRSGHKILEPLQFVRLVLLQGASTQHVGSRPERATKRKLVAHVGHQRRDDAVLLLGLHPVGKHAPAHPQQVVLFLCLQVGLNAVLAVQEGRESVLIRLNR